MLCLDTLLTGREDNLPMRSDFRFAFERTDVMRSSPWMAPSTRSCASRHPRSPRVYLDLPVTLWRPRQRHRATQW